MCVMYSGADHKSQMCHAAAAVVIDQQSQYTAVSDDVASAADDDVVCECELTMSACQPAVDIGMPPPALPTDTIHTEHVHSFSVAGTTSLLGSLCTFVSRMFGFYHHEGCHTSWKVVEFKKGIFQACKVLEIDCGHGKVSGIPTRSWNYLTVG